MVKKSEPAETPRKGMSMRLADDLRTKLEWSAAHSNRTVGSDIEHRLNASFKLDFVNSTGLSALLGNAAATDFISSLGAVIDGLLKTCRDRKFSEVETRKALRAALSVLISQHLWTGEDIPAVPGADGAKVKDLPPVRLGQRWATEHMVWDAAWNDRAVVDDTGEGRISNRWSGDGSMIELGKPPKPEQSPRNLSDLSLDEIEADPRFEKAENLHLYKRID
ncbi:hypothetical protein FOHLNKBM_5514 [Methylobacterium longum]|uniref:hypothetical protein n=1 Tax=Methylobacterium longum TaxID=767694 RepID=UPI001EE39EED|nr:hypothetical protein [Methylobacterium longum]GJE14439.1 hypothetical protein FOHLNKBM_5514 [Methylobacterium longum]